MQTKMLGALLCALLFVTACGKKENRGKHIKNVEFGSQLSEKLRAEKGFDASKNCAQIVEKDGKNALVVYGEACPQEGLAGGEVASFTYLKSRASSRGKGAATFYVFLNESPVGVASSAPKQTADAIDFSSMDNDSLNQEPSTIGDLMALNDMFRAAGEIQIVNGTIRSVKGFPAMERFSREEEMLRQMKKTQDMLATMLTTQQRQFDTIIAYIRSSSDRSTSQMEALTATMLQQYEDTIAKIEEVGGNLSQEMKDGFEDTKSHLRVLAIMNLVSYLDLKATINLQAKALHKHIGTRASATKLQLVSNQITALSADLEKVANRLKETATKQDVQDAVSEIESHINCVTSAIQETLATLATKEGLSQVEGRLTTNLNARLNKITRILRQTATKRQLETVISELAAVKRTVDTLATSAEIELLSCQLEALQSLAETLATKKDVTTATAEIKSALLEQVKIVKRRLRTIRDEQRTMSTNLKNAIAAYDKKFEAIEKVLEKNTDQLAKIAEMVKSANEALKALATKEELETLACMLEGSIHTLSNDVAEFREQTKELVEGQIKSVTDMVSKLATKDELKNEINGVHMDLRAVEAKFADLAKASDVSAQATKISELAGQIQALRRKVSRLATKTQVDAISMQLGGLSNLIEMVGEGVEALTASLECELGALNAQIAELATKDDVKALSGKLEALTKLSQDVEAIRTQVRALVNVQLTQNVKQALKTAVDGAKSLFQQLKGLLNN